MKKSLLILAAFIVTAGNVFAGQKPDKAFFDATDAFFKGNVTNGLVDYAAAKNSAALNALIKQVEEADISTSTPEEIQAFYINAYNLTVIKAAAVHYPTSSVQEISGFFDSQKHVFAGKKMTLNDLEKNELLKVYKDARYHFVLVCGAISCPPITNFAYRPEKLEEQLNQQAKLALNDPAFIKVDNAGKSVELSEIFKWYASDFGGSKKEVLNFINKYRNTAIPADYSSRYYTYNWALNEANTSAAGTGDAGSGAQGNNASRYVVSSAIAKGTHELKLFNNLYSQVTGPDENQAQRNTFYSATVSYLYGVSNRFNFGFFGRYRRVRNTIAEGSSNFDVFKGPDGAQSTRNGLTYLGPQLRWAPTKRLPNFSIQSSFQLPIGEDQEGIDAKPFIDWNKATWITQFFNDFSIGSNFSVFTEIDFIIEDFGSEDGDVNQTSTPVTIIPSYFPNPKTTLYVLGSYSPFWDRNRPDGQPNNYFYQFGAGAKYQVTKKLEFEVLYTDFTNRGLAEADGRANTVNLGIRKSF